MAVPGAADGAADNDKFQSQIADKERHANMLSWILAQIFSGWSPCPNHHNGAERMGT